MIKRLLCLIPIFAVCLAAAPEEGSQAHGEAAVPHIARNRQIVTPVEFEALLKTDPIAALEASLTRFERDVRGYSCILQKQETLGGKLGSVEVIRHAVREEPFAAYFSWEQGGGSAKASLYVAGDSGVMHVKTRLGVIQLAPSMGKSTSRYSIEDAGIYNASLRTLKAWKACHENGSLTLEYRGRETVPELNNRECHVVHRICNPPEVDNFRRVDPIRRDAASYPREAFGSVTLYFDCETMMQVGSVLWKPDGKLYGSYYFKDVKLNPTFTSGQFTPAFLDQ